MLLLIVSPVLAMPAAGLIISPVLAMPATIPATNIAIEHHYISPRSLQSVGPMNTGISSLTVNALAILGTGPALVVGAERLFGQTVKSA